MAVPANTRFLYISGGVAFFLLVLLLAHHRDAVTEQVRRPFGSPSGGHPLAHINSTVEHDHPFIDYDFDNAHFEEYPNNDEFYPEGKKVAYATWYSSTQAHGGEDYKDDVYFTATRMLAYQLLHDPKTRTRRGIPFVILVTPDVSQSRRDRLAKDGAIVKPIDWLTTDNEWYHAGRANWVGIMSKLFIYEMTGYDRVLLIDGDTLLQRPLDGVFDDPGTKVRKTLTDPALKPGDEGELPDEYLLASLGEVKGPMHDYPPRDEDWIDPNLFCAGFFMMHPDPRMLAYLKSVMVINDRFRPDLMEQALLNYIHRRDGPMPWTLTSRHWNIRDVNWNDYENGVVSAHMKWWEQPMSGEKKVRDWFHEVRGQMEGFYQGYDLYRTRFPHYKPQTP